MISSVKINDLNDIICSNQYVSGKHILAPGTVIFIITKAALTDFTGNLVFTKNLKKLAVISMENCLENFVENVKGIRI